MPAHVILYICYHSFINYHNEVLYLYLELCRTEENFWGIHGFKLMNLASVLYMKCCMPFSLLIMHSSCNSTSVKTNCVCVHMCICLIYLVTLCTVLSHIVYFGTYFLQPMVSQSMWLAQMMMFLYPCPKLTRTNTTTCSTAIIAEMYSPMELLMGLFGILSQVRYWIWVKAKFRTSINNMLYLFLCCLITREHIFYKEKRKTKYRIINGLSNIFISFINHWESIYIWQIYFAIFLR